MKGARSNRAFHPFLPVRCVRACARFRPKSCACPTGLLSRFDMPVPQRCPQNATLVLQNKVIDSGRCRAQATGSFRPPFLFRHSEEKDRVMGSRMRLLFAVPMLATGLTWAGAPQADAQWHRGYGPGYGYRGGYHHHHGGALLGGLAAGAVIGALGAGLVGRAAPPPPVVYAPPPVVYASPPPVVYAAPPPPGYYRPY
jgi:hypothetical protein